MLDFKKLESPELNPCEEAHANKPSSFLLNAALAGLMGTTLAACGEKEVEKEKIVQVEVAAASAEVTKVTEGLTDLTLAKFTSDCGVNEGLVQLHASCSGTNSCKGTSFSHGTLIEHTCKGVNTCAGMSCVELPVDGGLTGAQILEGQKDGNNVGSKIECNFCHGSGLDKFVLPISPESDEAAAKAAYLAKSDQALVNAVAFGIHGVKGNGLAFSNMPGFYTSYSKKEIERVVTHLRSLTLEVKKWEDPQ